MVEVELFKCGQFGTSVVGLDRILVRAPIKKLFRNFHLLNKISLVVSICMETRFFSSRRFRVFSITRVRSLIYPRMFYIIVGATLMVLNMQILYLDQLSVANKVHCSGQAQGLPLQILAMSLITNIFFCKKNNYNLLIRDN
jgi:hypothetical protein